MKKGCIFCKIVQDQIPCVKIWENKKFLAFLDICPNTQGMTLVVPKKHYSADVFKMPKSEYGEFLQAARKVVNILKKGLKVEKVGLVIEGTEVDHAHIKLYPFHGLGKKFKPAVVNKKRVYFDKYPGYLTTVGGPMRTLEELKKVARKIKKKQDK